MIDSECFNAPIGNGTVHDRPEASCAVEFSERNELTAEVFDESLEQIIEGLHASARSWSQATRNVSHYINQGRDAIDANDARAATARAERRSSGQSRDSYLAQAIAEIHNDAAREMTGGVLEGMHRSDLVSDELLSREHLFDLEQTIVRQQVARTQTPSFNAPVRIYHELVTVFQLEYVTRAYMQMLNQEAPEALQALFDPATLAELPQSLQRIATLDIKRGVGDSVLLDNANSQLPDERPESVILAEYIKANSLPEHVKKSLMAIKLGMDAMGAPNCPFNDLGMCTHILAKIPREQLPDDIQRDMTAKNDAAVSKRTNDLLNFSRRNPVSRIFDSKVVLYEEGPQSQSKTSKRSALPKLEKKDFAKPEEESSEEAAFSKVVFRVAKSDVIAEAPTDNEDGLMSAIESVFEQKLVSDYLDKHNDTKLNDMVAGAVAAIGLSQTYVKTGRMIVPWAGRKNKPYINDEGVKERFMRYSGAQAAGVSGGNIGRHTRIIFSQGTKDGVRYVTIHDILHKSDIKTGTNV